jgi:Phage integrase, N-terminal SAM-like domain
MLQQKSPKIDEEDERIIELWLQTKSSAATREAYARDVADFQNCADKSLRDLLLDDVLAYSRRLEKDYEPRSRRRKIAAVKSLLSFAFKLGHLPVLRQNLVTIDIVDFLKPNATLYWYEGITILAVLLFQSLTQRSMQFGSREPCLTATTCHPEANPKAAGNQYKGPPVLGLVISNLV